MVCLYMPFFLLVCPVVGIAVWCHELCFRAIFSLAVVPLLVLLYFVIYVLEVILI